MERAVERKYVFKASEVHEAIIAYLKSQDIPSPKYIGNTPTTTWVWGTYTIAVTWKCDLDSDRPASEGSKE